MLEIVVPQKEFYDEMENRFFFFKGQTLVLEHSLVSISKWEARYKIPFLTSKKTPTQKLDYVRFMTITQNVDDLAYYSLTEKNIVSIDEYIEDPMTSTTFHNLGTSKSQKEVVTSEIIYYWMIIHNVPFECQKWHLNRLLTLISVCNLKNSGSQQKLTKAEIFARNRELNRQRRSALNSRG